MNRRETILYVLMLLSAICLCSCASVGVEKAKYTVIEKAGEFEVRQYEPQIIAETTVEADFDDAGNIAFRRYEAKKALLEEFIGDKGLRTTGEL